MDEQMKTLVKLQEIDSQLYSLRREKGLKPLQLKGLRGEYERKEEAVKKLEEDIRALQLARKNKELDLETKEASVKKLQSQLYQIKTNKEYSSLKSEIESHKADNSLLEEEILLLLDRIDEFKTKVDAERSSLGEASKKLKEEEGRIEGEIKDIDQKIEGLNGNRSNLTASIEKRLLARYEKILANKNGLAIVPVKYDSCQGCHIGLPPQVINEISMKDKIIACESCTRILYIEE